MTKNLSQDLEALSKTVWNIEKKLPQYNLVAPTSKEQEFRRDLYRIRIRISELQRQAKAEGIEYE